MYTNIILIFFLVKDKNIPVYVLVYNFNSIFNILTQGKR